MALPVQCFFFILIISCKAPPLLTRFYIAIDLFFPTSIYHCYNNFILSYPCLSSRPPKSTRFHCFNNKEYPCHPTNYEITIPVENELKNQFSFEFSKLLKSKL